MSSNYPLNFDTNENLYEVHDGLRVKLADDYMPGDTSITIIPHADIMAKFPDTGIITLTEQVSDIDQRAISFEYTSKTDTGFFGLKLLAGFEDVPKAKTITNVTQNVMAAHHNNIKDSLVEIQKFIGVKGTEDTMPNGSTLEGRTNFLRRLVYTPRAYFACDKTTGIVPMTVKFTDQSFRLGNGPTTFIWDFGDQDVSVISFSTISAISSVPSNIVNALVHDTDGGTIEKTYTKPGVYAVKLTAINDLGQDTVVIPNAIIAKTLAPNEAYIVFGQDGNQITTSGDETPTFDRMATRPGGPFTFPPTVRASTGSYVNIEIPEGALIPYERSYAGEALNESGNPVDAIQQYTWSMGDDLTHENARQAKASYSIGGLYDLKLRVDTQHGAYRITTYENCIDIIEKRNLWLWNITDTTAVKAHEFGLVSETFKTGTRTYAPNIDDTFLDGTNGEAKAKHEFARNTAFIPVGTGYSGSRGKALLAWAASEDTIDTIEYEGFADTYTSAITLSKSWNWIAFSDGNKAYFLFGNDSNNVPNTNYVEQSKTTLDLTSGYAAYTDSIASENYKNGAIELQENPTTGFTDGEPDDGRFSVYKTAWKNPSGYILRNDGAGVFFRIKSFYKTDGILGSPIENIYKLSDMTGNPKTEGQLVTLSSGVFFFNNSGSISAYNDSSNVWETGGPSSASSTFRSLQDGVTGFDNIENTLLATSDGDRTVYLSYDYSRNAMIKFNLTDLTFTSSPARPQAANSQQWMMGIY